MFCHGQKSETRNHPSTPCSLLNCTKAIILWVKITLLFGAYFLALLETWIMLFLHTKPLSAQEPRGRISSSKCQTSVIFFSLSSCHATEYQGRRYKSLMHWLLISFFFFFLPNSTWVKITISCSWKMGAAPTFPALINFMACPGLSPKQVQHQLHLGELQEMSGVTGVPCSRWDFWVLTTSESTEKEGEAFIYATLYVSDRLLRRSSTRTRTGLEKAGKGAQEKSPTCDKTVQTTIHQLGYRREQMMWMKWLKNDHSLFLAEYELRNTRGIIQMKNRKFFFIPLSQKITYTKYINTL